MTGQRFADRVRLDWIADRGAGAMRLEVTEIVGRNAGLRVDPRQQRRLRRTTGHGKTRGAAVGIHPGGPYHRANFVTVGHGLGQRLQHDRPAALGAHVAVGPRIERMTPPRPRQHRGAGKPDE